MLVLTRKLNEAITIGQLGITVTVVDVKGGRVRLGVNAPANVRISRMDAPHSDASHAVDALTDPEHTVSH